MRPFLILIGRNIYRILIKALPNGYAARMMPRPVQIKGVAP